MVEQITNQLSSGGSIPTSPLQYTVREIPPAMTHEWLLKKHYAHRIPQIMYAFGLYDGAKIIHGVCTFGWACRGIQDRYKPTPIYELNRLVITDNIKNGASQLVSGCFRIFPTKPCFIVSYADSNQGHHGYIYQALNGIYTGLSSSERKVFINGQLTHRRTLNALYGTSSVESLSKSLKEKYNAEVEVEEQEGKHRYFWILGNKKERSQLRISLGYDTFPYPKGDNQRYDASYEPPNQGVLI